MAIVRQKPTFKKHLLISLCLHVAILAIFIISFEFNSQRFVLENSNNKEIVNAVIVDSSKIQMANPTPIAPAKIKEEIKKITPEKPPIKMPTPTKKLVEPKTQQRSIAIPDPLKKQKALIEKQLLTELKKQTDLKKKAKQKALEQDFEKELKSQAAKSLQEQLRNEQNRLASSQAQKMSGVVDKYKALILQAIAQHWLVPNGVDKSKSSELLIRVAAGGTVLDVQLVKSSGDDALDRSARAAVFKASPLPVPTIPDEFEPFRQFILKVKPENVTTREGGL